MQLSSFEEKKRHPRQGNPNEETGYFNGSYSEREIAAFEIEIWRHNEILERGITMLGFMAERWEISLAEEIRKTLNPSQFRSCNAGMTGVELAPLHYALRVFGPSRCAYFPRRHGGTLIVGLRTGNTIVHVTAPHQRIVTDTFCYILDGVSAMRNNASRMNEEKPNKSDKQPRTRSPAYPAIDLEDAISKAIKVWEKANRHAVTVDVIGTYWGYDAKSSAGISASSAMKKYGLLVEEGSKDNRTVKLSELGIKLIYKPDLDSPEHKAALAEAALNPSIHLELWNRYGGDLPDDSVIKRYLVVDRKFNADYVDSSVMYFFGMLGRVGSRVCQ